MAFWFPHSFSPFMQHKLCLAADDGIRQLVEQTKREVSLADNAAGMKDIVEKKAMALCNKMGKLIVVSNPKLTDGWLVRYVHQTFLHIKHFTLSLK